MFVEDVDLILCGSFMEFLCKLCGYLEYVEFVFKGFWEMMNIGGFL